MIATQLVLSEKPDGAPVDPRSNNRQDLQVVIGAKEIDPAMFANDFILNENTGAEIGGIPPGSINLYVFSSVDEAPCVLDADDDDDVDGVDLAQLKNIMDDQCLQVFSAQFGLQSISPLSWGRTTLIDKNFSINSMQ